MKDFNKYLLKEAKTYNIEISGWDDFSSLLGGISWLVTIENNYVGSNSKVKKSLQKIMKELIKATK